MVADCFLAGVDRHFIHYAHTEPNRRFGIQLAGDGHSDAVAKISACHDVRDAHLPTCLDDGERTVAPDETPDRTACGYRNRYLTRVVPDHDTGPVGTLLDVLLNGVGAILDAVTALLFL